MGPLSGKSSYAKIPFPDSKSKTWEFFTDDELSDQQANPETDNERAVAANDNAMRWPLVPFPEDWYASF
jgi:hypothetical protein